MMAKVQQRMDALLVWYDRNKRFLPWRSTRDPYRIWVSEVMLQQTRVETVIPYYEHFIEQFPSVESLARAELSSVLKEWEGLGYYARARNLHRSAELVVEKYGGVVPLDYAALKSLPGIGDYTAAAIASIAFDQPVPVLDGNAQRVIARWVVLREDPRSPEGTKRLRRVAGKFLDQANPGRWNSAVMELGALICAPRNPRCDDCPVKSGCEAFRLDLTDRIPARKARKRIPHFQVTAGLIWKGSDLLIAQRKEDGLLGGLWEFPGGKLEDSETLQECLRRELSEELAIDVRIGEEVCLVNHAYSHFRITLHVFQCKYLSGLPQAIGVAQWKWVKAEQLPEFAFPRADRRVIEELTRGNALYPAYRPFTLSLSSGE